MNARNDFTLKVNHNHEFLRGPICSTTVAASAMNIPFHHKHGNGLFGAYPPLFFHFDQRIMREGHFASRTRKAQFIENLSSLEMEH